MLVHLPSFAALGHRAQCGLEAVACHQEDHGEGRPCGRGCLRWLLSCVVATLRIPAKGPWVLRLELFICLSHVVLGWYRVSRVAVCLGEAVAEDFIVRPPWVQEEGHMVCVPHRHVCICVVVM